MEMDLDATPPTVPAEATTVCSICLDPVVAASDGARSVASLLCGHKFHLDCIGSAFNAKGIMQCPNCRNIENGNWLNANAHQPSTDSYSHFGTAVTRETYQAMIDHHMQQVTAERIIVNRVTMEAHQLLSNLLQQSTAGSLTLLNSVFRNLELHSASYRSNSEAMPFYHHATGMEGGPTADLSNIHVFGGSEPRNFQMEQRSFSTLPMVYFVNPVAPFSVEVPGHDGSNQQHSTQPTPGSGSSSVAPLGPSPAVTSVGHAGHGLVGHALQQTVPPATPRSPYPPTATSVRPRALSIASSIAAASYRAENREPHDISRARAENVQNNNIPSQDIAARRADQPYPYSLGQDTRWRAWRPSAEPGTSSQHNQEDRSIPSTSTSGLPP